MTQFILSGFVSGPSSGKQTLPRPRCCSQFREFFWFPTFQCRSLYIAYLAESKSQLTGSDLVLQDILTLMHPVAMLANSCATFALLLLTMGSFRKTLRKNLWVEEMKTMMPCLIKRKQNCKKILIEQKTMIFLPNTSEPTYQIALVFS